MLSSRGFSSRANTMHLRYLLASCIAVVIAAGTLAAAGSDTRVADAVRNRDHTNVRSLLKQRLDVNVPDAEGMTALHWAAHFDDLETAKLLLRAGANAKAANRYGVTPLHEACTVAIGKKLVRLLQPRWLRIGGYFHPRGGMPIDVFWQAGKLPAGTWVPDQGVSTYRARP